jgi:ubiquinone/menaquinone biosynthesis C-methylase UbiE
MTLRKKKTHNPFDDPAVAGFYEGWFETPAGKAIDTDETTLILSMLPGSYGETFLDVGCGTGHFSRVLTFHGYIVFGSDLSRAMLTEAKARGESRLLISDAHRLPHADRAFDAAGTFTVLEFTANPQAVVSEMLRVSKKAVVIAFLNKLGMINLRRRVRNLMGKRDVYSDARFFGVSEMKRLAKKAAVSQGRTAAIQWGSAVGFPRLKRLFSRSRFQSFILFVVRLDEAHA